MKSLIGTCLAILFCTTLFAQRKYNGRIANLDGAPIPFATLRSESGKEIFKADSLGRFNIPFKGNALTLLVSAMGFETQKVQLRNRQNDVAILLVPRENILDEVEINTGYQTLPKERATGSFGQIANKELNTMTTVNIMDRLEGKVAGLQYDNRKGKPVINIRGLNTFSEGSSRPLIVLDNFPYDGDLETINPNDIESVTVLKDAAASSIWGSRAGNGVIVINSKKGRGLSKTIVNFSSNLLITQKPDLFYKPAISSADFLGVERMLFEKGFYDNAHASSTKQRIVFSPFVELLYANKAGIVSKEELEQKRTYWSTKDYRKDYSDQVLRNALGQQYFVDLESNTNKNRMRASIGYDRQAGTQVGTKSNRLTFKLSNETTLANRLTLRTNVDYTESLNKNSATIPSENLIPGGTRSAIYPYAELMDQNGNALVIPKGVNAIFADTAGGGRLLDWTYRPLEDMDKSAVETRLRHIRANLNLRYKILDALQAELTYGYEHQSGGTDLSYQEESFYVRDLINRYTLIENGNVKYNVPRGGVLNKSANQLQAHRIRGQFNFNKSIGNNHQLNWLLGGEISSTNSTEDSYGVYGYDEDVMTSKNVDYISLFPIYGNLSGKLSIPSFSGYKDRMIRYVSLYSNVQYDLLGRYSFSASARKDASNGFGSKTNTRWNPLWSAGFAWNLAKEHFIQNIGWIDRLKLRATVGVGGNAVPSSATEVTLTFSSNSTYTYLPFAQVVNPPNASLKWESVRMNNYGLDFGLLGDRLSGSVEYYTKRSFDILSPDFIDPTTGFGAMTKNIGEIKSKGLDINLTGQINFGQVRWTPQVIFSYASNVITSYKGTVGATVNYVNGGSSITPMEGKQLYPVFSYRFAGLDPQNGDPMGYLKGDISKNYPQMIADSLQYLNFHGTALPPYYGSFNNSVTYKKFTVSMNLLFKWGHYFRRESIAYASLFNSWAGHGDFAKRWLKSGDEQITSVPSMSYPADANRDNFYLKSDANIDRGDLIRFQSVRLSYNTMLNTGSRAIRAMVFVGANNLGIIWKKSKSTLDPDFIGTPNPRLLTMGLNLQF